MSPKDSAIAFVRWKTFRPSDGGGGGASFDFGSNNQSLLKKAASGGTLWLVTSTKREKARQYHLAYKLVDCTQVAADKSAFSGAWKFVVRARDWKSSRHFPYNNSTEALRSLEFLTGSRMAASRNMGLRLLSIPALSPNDIKLLDGLQSKIESARTVFLSYARKDEAVAERIESILAQHDIVVRRDLSFIEPGDEWRNRISDEVASADVVLVLISKNSSQSEWVKKEVGWALSEYRQGRFVKRILPVVMDASGWDLFPELHEFQRWVLSNDRATIDQLPVLLRLIQLAQSRVRVR